MGDLAHGEREERGDHERRPKSHPAIQHQARAPDMHPACQDRAQPEQRRQVEDVGAQHDPETDVPRPGAQ
jgi:hypothetical protein